MQVTLSSTLNNYKNERIFSSTAQLVALLQEEMRTLCEVQNIS